MPGSWQFPGGHLELREQLLTCAERETAEETGLEVKGIKVAAVTNDIFASENKHYITLFVLCEMLDAGAEPKVSRDGPVTVPRDSRANLPRGLKLMEPDKCHGWHWRTWEDLEDIKDKGEPSGAKLFLPMANLLEQFASLDDLRQKFR